MPRSIVISWVAAWMVSMALGSAWAAPAFQAYHLVLPRRPLSPGEQIEVRIEPTPPPDTDVIWFNAEQIGARAGHDEDRFARYTAPFIVDPSVSTAELSVVLSSAEMSRLTVVGRVNLRPGEVPGARECLGPGQSYSSTQGAIGPDLYIRSVHSLTVPQNDSAYPRSAVARGMTGRAIVRALLCTNGRVLAAYPEKAYDFDFHVVEWERIFTEAALEIVAGRTFPPLAEGGSPIAGWIQVHVLFRD